MPLDHMIAGIGFDLTNQTWPGRDVIIWEGGVSLELWKGGREPINVQDYDDYIDQCREYYIGGIENTGCGQYVQFLFSKELQNLKQGNYIGVIKNGCDISCCKIHFLVGQDICFENIRTAALCSEDESHKSPLCMSCTTLCCEESMEVKYQLIPNSDGTFLMQRIEIPGCGCPEPKIDPCCECVPAPGNVKPSFI